MPQPRPSIAKMPWVEVDSSHIRGVAWWPDRRRLSGVEIVGRLYVRFTSSDAVYIYENVESDEYAELLLAESAGKAFSHIKQAPNAYPFQQVNPCRVCEWDEVCEECHS
jgi:KTSC domain